MADDKKRSAFSKPSSEGGSYGSGSTGPSYGVPSGGDSLEPDPGRKFQYSGDGDPMGVPPPSAAAGLPEKVKIDLNTPLETVLTGVALGAGIISLMLLYGGSCSSYSKHSRRTIPPNPELLNYLPLTIGIAAVAGFARIMTDNFYILDTVEKKIYYHFKIFSFESVSLFMRADQVAAAGVTGVYKSSKHGSWWEYKIVLVDREGKMIDFSDFKKEEYYGLNERAKGIAAVLGCPFAESGPQMVMAVKKGEGMGGAPLVYFEEHSTLKSIGDTMLMIFIAIGVIAVIGMLMNLMGMFR